MAEDSKTALVVGASRGLGLGLAQTFLRRGWNVIATTRGARDEGLRALETDGRLRVETLDVTDPAGLAALARKLAGQPLDILFVSAGIAADKKAPAASEPPEVFDRVMRTNAYAPLCVIEAFGDHLVADGVAVAMTSVLGSVAGNTTGAYEIYRASKAALNTLLRCYAARHPDRAVVAMHPGWVRTDMAGPDAPLSVAESAAGIVDVIETRRGKAGCVFLDHAGKTVPW